MKSRTKEGKTYTSQLMNMDCFGGGFWFVKAKTYQSNDVKKDVSCACNLKVGVFRQA